MDTNLMPSLCQVADPRYRATGYGVLNMFNMLVGGLTVYIGGARRDAHVNVNTLSSAPPSDWSSAGGLLLRVKPWAAVLGSSTQ
jgi:hypothetical protein